MDEQLRRYESYVGGVKRLLLLAGLWPSRVPSKLFKLVIAIHAISGIFTGFGILYFVVDHITNIGLATKGLGIAVSFCTIILKLIVFTIYRDQHVELHEMLQKIFHRDLENPEYRSLLLSPLRYFYRPTIWLTISTFGIITIYNYPFPASDALYAACYVIEVWASFAIGSITAATDALFGFYVFQMASQFRVLSHRMISLTEWDDHRGVIKECAVRRRILADCRDKLQTIYGPIILWMLATSAMTMCANIFQASQISVDKAILVFVYITMKLLQTLLYGWYGLFLTIESEAFREAIYCSGWPGCGDKLFLSNVRTMLMLVRPMTLKACHFSTVSLDMFMMIMNTTFSYFFLLRTIDEK